MDVNGTGNKTYLKNETIVGSNDKIKIKRLIYDRDVLANI